MVPAEPSSRLNISEERPESTIGADAANGNSAHGHKPRRGSRRRKSKSERGLPADSELKELARVYLDTQRTHWPDLVQRGILPEPSEAVLEEMAGDFKRRHNGEHPTPVPVIVLSTSGRLGASYSRFSCDNSNPHSIADQLVKEISKAKDESCFIGWQHVYADYAVSGLDSGRLGYNALKNVLSDPECQIDTVYIDDFTRVSRDEIEWWRLAALMKRLGKRLVGASDGFDLSNENADVMLSVYSMLSRLFMKNLRQKVRRGMAGAARRGTSLGRPPLGYSLVPADNVQGNPIHGKDGERLNMLSIDPEGSKYVTMAFELFGIKRWTKGRIAKEFNRLEADGGNGWTNSSIHLVLRNRIYIGEQIFNKTKHERDPETHKVVITPKPQSEWITTPMPHLRVVPDDLWKLVQDRLDAVSQNSPMTGKRLSRNERSASTLFSGTMFCGYCGAEIKLARSGKWPCMGCFHGITGVHGCQLRSVKGLKTLEESLIGFLHEHILNRETIEKLIVEANAFLAADAAKPRIEVAPIRAAACKIQGKIRKLVLKVEEEPDEKLSRGYDLRIKELEKQLAGVTGQLRENEARNQQPPSPLLKEDVEHHLKDVRELLNQEVPAAAEFLRTLTGRITIKQEPHPTPKPGARWVASFQPNLPSLLAKGARVKLWTDCATWEYLSDRIWTPPQSVSVVIDFVPKYQAISKQVSELASKGMSAIKISFALGVSGELVGRAIRFIKTGDPRRPASKRPRKPWKPRSMARQYLDLAPEVARLKSEEGWTFPRIGKHLSISAETARKAYWHFHREELRYAGRRGKKLSRPTFSHLGFSRLNKIRELGAAGRKIAEIAKAVGCSVTSVYRILTS
jgi:DNA invertase Pin-like site-specific DNA recombinase